MAKGEKGRNNNGNNNSSNQNKNTPKKDPNIQSIETLQQKYAQEMASTLGPDSLLQYTNITANVLKNEFEQNCAIDWRIVDGNYRLYVTQTGTAKKSVGQLHLIVNKNTGKYNIRLNPYSKFEKEYYLAEGVDTKGLMNEMPAIKSFMATEKVPE